MGIAKKLDEEAAAATAQALSEDERLYQERKKTGFAVSAPDGPPKPIDEMTLEELNLYIARTQAQTVAYALDDAKKQHKERHDKEADREKRYQRSQADFAADRVKDARIQKACRHKQGGTPDKVLRGNGAPCVVRTLMPDGFTYLLQCLRCRLRVFTPNPKLAQTDPKLYAREKARYDKMWELCEDSDSSEIRSPSFIFMKDGVPFIPERTGGMPNSGAVQ